MPIYECRENQFIENLRKLLDTNFKIIVKRLGKIHDDAKHNISRLPESESTKYDAILYKKGVRSNVYAAKPFYDELHKRFYHLDEQIHSNKYWRAVTLSIPYIRMEYSFDIWGETYCYSFDALFQPEIKIEKKKLKSQQYDQNSKSKSVLIHVLSFTPPSQETLQITLPPSVIIFDISQKLRP